MGDPPDIAVYAAWAQNVFGVAMPIDHFLAKAKHYRDRADQMRALASADPDFGTRASLKALADSYEQLYREFMAGAIIGQAKRDQTLRGTTLPAKKQH